MVAKIGRRHGPSMDAQMVKYRDMLSPPETSFPIRFTLANTSPFDLQAGRLEPWEVRQLGCFALVQCAEMVRDSA